MGTGGTWLKSGSLSALLPTCALLPAVMLHWHSAARALPFSFQGGHNRTELLVRGPGFSEAGGAEPRG